MKLLCLGLAWGSLFSLAAAETSPGEWKPLFPDQNSFAGFRQLGGKAHYEIKDGLVTGTSVAGEPNSFMATEKEFGDFELEYEFQVDEKLNSGVQIRSHSVPSFKKGQVHGYQVEIDPSARAWSGGIYEEGRRGWLAPLDQNKAAGAAFKHKDWNKVRVRAVGDSIQTWINEVPAADLRDAMDQSGFIALQVHGVGKDASKVGTKVQWRNLRLKELGAHCWQPLFDGKSLSGWQTEPGGEWKVEDSAIHGTSPASEARHGMLLYEKPLSDFTLRLNFKVNRGNSGVYFRSEKVAEGVSVHGIQAEVCENEDTGGLYETGGRGWLVQPDKARMQKEKVYQPGQWNEIWISAHGKRLVVHVNGKKTADFTDEKQTRLSGLLGLQLHGGQDMDVQFKDLALLTPGQ